MVVPPARVVDTLSSPGKRPSTTPDAANDPRICAIKRRVARIHPIAPIKAMPSVTAGLKSPPDTRKNTQAFTARLKPNASAMYESEAVLGACEIPPSPPSLASDVPPPRSPAVAALAT
jgi:hypothetical protein